jgi:hypothetical protein
MARSHPFVSAPPSQGRPPRQSGDGRQRHAGRRRALIASIVGSLILAGVALPLLPKIVVARGPISDSPYAVLTGSGGPQGAYAPAEEHSAGAGAASGHKSWAGGQPVCVRLCDGAFFPVSAVDAANQESTCSALCPDAPTALYREPAGSDKIEDAVSPQGSPYIALPVALRYRTTLDNACTCHRARTQQYAIARDATLRKGDYVMTPNGIVVFAGGKSTPHAQSDFTALAAASISQAQRAALMAIERVSQLNGEGSGGKAPVASSKRQSTPEPLLSVSALPQAQPGGTESSN